MEYIQSSNTIIINYNFNEVQTNKYIEILKKYNKMIFSNYKLNDELFEAYEAYEAYKAYETYKNDKFNSLKCIGNYFNKQGFFQFKTLEELNNILDNVHELFNFQTFKTDDQLLV